MDNGWLSDSGDLILIFHRPRGKEERLDVSLRIGRLPIVLEVPRNNENYSTYLSPFEQCNDATGNGHLVSRRRIVRSD